MQLRNLFLALIGVALHRKRHPAMVALATGPVVSRFSADDDISACIGHDMRLFLEKPFSQEQFDKPLAVPAEQRQEGAERRMRPAVQCTTMAECDCWPYTRDR